MKISSVNVGRPQSVLWQGKLVTTGIFKNPTEGPTRLVGVNFEGDGQADLRVHGGPDKAVYAYASEHYDFWQTELPDYQFEPGNFGENLTTQGLLDTEVRLGDQFRIGTTVLMAVQPRFPCAKLGLRFNDSGMTKRFALARRHGIYFRVVEEGHVQAGDSIELVKPSAGVVTIQEVVDNFYGPKQDFAKIGQILAFPELPRFLRETFGKMRSQAFGT